MNNTHPWWPGHGRPFLLDKPDWLLYPERRAITGQMLSGRRIKEDVWGNCIGNGPYAAWIRKQILAGLSTHDFDGWVMDGDFFGGGGIVRPVDCPSAGHDHLAGDATYASDLALSRLIADVRKAAPDTYTFMCRPRQDEGVFLQRNVDAVFTIDEFGEAEPLPGLQAQPRNMILGDKIRKWSRVRVHQDFFPHYIDQPQVFSGPKGMRDQFSRDWSSEAIDYVMLSAMSSSPNQLYYLLHSTGAAQMSYSAREVLHLVTLWRSTKVEIRLYEENS